MSVGEVGYLATEHRQQHATDVYCREFRPAPRTPALGELAGVGPHVKGLPAPEILLRKPDSSPCGKAKGSVNRLVDHVFLHRINSPASKTSTRERWAKLPSPVRWPRPRLRKSRAARVPWEPWITLTIVWDCD